MNAEKKKDKELKILYVREVLAKSIKSVLDDHHIDKNNFYKGKVSEDKIDDLFDSVYDQVGRFLLLGILIKTGKLEDVAKQLNLGGKENEK